MTTVGPYARLSEARDGSVLAVDRQHTDEGYVCKARDWVMATPPYIDNDFSASKDNVIRPAFEKLLRDLEEGLIDGIVAYDLDRFVRRPDDLERVIKIYDHAKKKGRDLVFATVQGDLNLSTDDGITMARVLVAFANKESRNTARRVARKRREMAENGEPGGGHRPFGWKADRRTLEPREAALIRDAADYLLSGGTVTGVAARWTLVVPSPRGGIWGRKTIREILTNPRVAGFSVYRGEIVEKDGCRVRGLWQPILDVDRWSAVCALLNDRAPTSGGTRYLLSGVIRCHCGAQMYGTTKRPGVHIYRCSKDSGGCGRTAITGLAADRLISGLILELLDSVEAPERPTGDLLAIQEQIGDKTEQLKELMGAFHDKTITGAVFFPLAKQIEDEIADLRRRHGRTVRLVRPVGNIRERWDDGDVNQRRELIRLLLSAIVIHPTTRPGPRFDPSRVEPIRRSSS